MEFVTLNNGVEMPLEGYGVLQMSDPRQCEQAVQDAIECGYRLFDSAAAYMNEEAVGAAVRNSGVPREEFFIITKLWVQDASYEGAKRAIETSLEKMNIGVIDLFLIHQPIGDVFGAYRAMEEAYREGKLRAIGLSNFYPNRLVDMCESVEIIPQVNEVEIHPFFQQTQALNWMRKYEVHPVAWGPFAEGTHDLFNDPVLTEIGKKYGKTAAQVALRWNVQRGVTVIPKTVHKDRMQQNIDIWDFALSEDDMMEIATLDIGHSEIVDHRNPGYVKTMHGVKIH